MLKYFRYSQNFLFKSNVLLFFLLFIYSPKIYNQSLTAEQIYKKVSNAVVVILAYDSKDKLSSQGSGVVINDNGYVVTNYHVLAGNDRLEILHNKEIVTYVGIIGIDVEKDILILKIDAKKFPSLKICDSKTLTIGERVYAIGSPLGFENTISEGIISGLRSYEDYESNFIQITASISSGSSGGAVVNDKGELIGISSLTAKEGQNLNFAIPINDILAVKIGSYSKDESYKDFELYYKGNEAYNKGDYKEAIIFFTSYIKEYPNDYTAFFNRGLAKSNLEDFRGEIQDYTKAIEINPNYAEAYNNRGITKGKLEDYNGEIQDYTKAIEINPNYAEAYNNRGITKGKLEDYNGAIQDFNKAIKINPDDVKALTYRGIDEYMLEDYNRAIQNFNKAIEINPDDAGYAGAYYYRGRVKLILEDYRGAIQDYNKTIETNPNDAMAYYSRGIAKFNLGDKLGACLDWSKAGELADDDAYNLIRKYCE